jgi:hypothetical protein
VITLLRESLWLYPLLQAAHILGFIVLAGAAVLFDLRVLGLTAARAGAVSIRALGLHLLPWSVAAAALVVPTGVLLFAVEAGELIGNRAFLFKLLLLAGAAGNAIAFHLGPGRSWADWPADAPAPRDARLHALLSISLWIGVVVCARLIAFV